MGDTVAAGKAWLGGDLQQPSTGRVRYGIVRTHDGMLMEHI